MLCKIFMNLHIECRVFHIPFSTLSLLLVQFNQKYTREIWLLEVKMFGPFSFSLTGINQCFNRWISFDRISISMIFFSHSRLFLRMFILMVNAIFVLFSTRIRWRILMKILRTFWNRHYLFKQIPIESYSSFNSVLFLCVIFV